MLKKNALQSFLYFEHCSINLGFPNYMLWCSGAPQQTEMDAAEYFHILEGNIDT